MQQIVVRKQKMKLKSGEINALNDYLSRLVSRFGVQINRVILFGSRARGYGDAESDLDVLVIVNNSDWQMHDAVATESFESSIKFGVLISPITMSREEYEWNKQHRAPFYQQIEKDGYDLWTTKNAS
jgi:predicted nucleotidyltransferase